MSLQSPAANGTFSPLVATCHSFCVLPYKARICWFFASVTALILALGSPAVADTLEQVIRSNGIACCTPDGPPNPDSEINSYAFENGHDLFSIAYYASTDGSGGLPDTFHISTFDKETGAWLHRELPSDTEISSASTPTWSIGSILHVRHTRQYVYLDTHGSPSAGTVLILTRELLPFAALNGWTSLILPSGLALYTHSMVHFAPTHPSELWVFDPASGRDTLVYPAKPYGPVRQAYVDRMRELYAQISEEWQADSDFNMDPEQCDNEIVPPLVPNEAGTAVAFVVRLGNGGDTPVSAPIREILVVCNDLSTGGYCTEADFETVRLHHPDWSNERILHSAVAGG